MARKTVSKDPQKKFFIVGIGASAGGLETLGRFLKAMPDDKTGMAFVIIQHLDPNHKSLMPELLSKYTQMPVIKAENNVQVLPDKIYIISPNTVLTIKKRRLHSTSPLEPHGHRMPVDNFFRSLAGEWGPKAICIVMSGTGTDGTLGLKSVKEHGGLTVAQEPETAKYDSMPSSAIATGQVDLICPVEEMPEKLISYGQHPEINISDELQSDINSKNALKQLYSILHSRTGHCFTYYKKNTLLRRIQRRMQILRLESLTDYVKNLKQNPDEVHELFKDLLISVTQFFRDKNAFESLEKVVIPEIVKHSPETVRVWVPGCATGEEAYSIAMLLFEYIDDNNLKTDVQIFATDIDAKALTTARLGIYPDSIAEYVDKQRLKKFFYPEGSSYHVDKRLRESCLFSSHNLTKDPPFSKIDLLSCRNLMIYFETELQKRLIPVFSYALNPGGYLFLGPSENISANPDHFKTVDKKHRIFQVRQIAKQPVNLPLWQSGPRSVVSLRKEAVSPRATYHLELRNNLEKAILQKYAPPGVLVNEKGDIVYYSGRTSKYLEQPPGIPSSNIFDLAKSGLKIDLRTTFHKATSGHKQVISHNITVNVNGSAERINLIISPLSTVDHDDGLYTVIFKELGKETVQTHILKTGSTDKGEQVAVQLEQELKETKERLQTTVEELETSNEELKSSNEELMSMNEELQSSNEELQTSKEELQSVNEELETVNVELNTKIQDLDHANNDLKNLFESTQIATIFLDTDLKIKRFTPASRMLFRLVEEDLKRSIIDIAPRFWDTEFISDLKKVLDTLVPVERQIHITNENTQWFIMKILPYRTVENFIDGVVLTFTDITEQKQIQQTVERSEKKYRTLTEATTSLVFTMDAEGKFNKPQQQWETYTGQSFSEYENAGWLKALHSEDSKNFEKALIKALKSGELFEIEARFWSVRVKKYNYFTFRAVPLIENQHISEWVGTLNDIDAYRRSQEEIKNMAKFPSENPSPVLRVDRNGIILYANEASRPLLQEWKSDVGHNTPQFVYELIEKALSEKTIRTININLSDIVLLFSIVPVVDFGYVNFYAKDITELVSTEKQLKELNQNLEKIVTEKTHDVQQKIVQLRGLTVKLTRTEQREKRHFAKILHDNLQQLLVAARLHIARAKKMTKKEEMVDDLNEATDILNESLKLSRSLTSELSPPILYDGDIIDVLEWLARWAKQSYELKVFVDADKKTIIQDQDLRVLLFPIIKELMLNIVKHANTDKCYISIGSTDEGLIKLIVRDEGVGFDIEEVQNKSFQQTFGLFGIKERIEQIEGTFNIRSVQGKGTTITIEVPDKKTLEREVPVSAAIEKGKRPKLSRRAKTNGAITIIIADDHQIFREGLYTLLSGQADIHIVDQAADGEQVIEQVERYQPDVVVMDISMPKIDGVEATRRIKQSFPHIRVIGLTMNHEQSIINSIINAGAEQCLTKDNAFDELIEVIKCPPR